MTINLYKLCKKLWPSSEENQEPQLSSNNANTRLTSKDILLLIEDNGGPRNLDLSHKDMTGIKLQPQMLNQLRRKMGLNDDVHPVWQCPKTGGVNLQDADLSWSVLSRADLYRACLRGADLRGVRLENVKLIDADLQDTILWDANLNDATLAGTDLRGANLFGASIINTYFRRRDSLGDTILQEKKDYELPPGISMTPDRNRFWQGSIIYRTLAANFDSRASYDDASWAYRKARRMEKQLARYYVGQAWHKREWKQLAARIWKWLSDSIVEILCDYGESIWRVISWILMVLFVIGPFLIWFSGGLNWTGDNKDFYFSLQSNWQRLLYGYFQSILYMLDVFTTADFSELAPRNDAVRITSGLLSMFGIFLVGLLGFVAGNRIRNS